METIVKVEVNGKTIEVYQSEGDCRDWDNHCQMIFAGGHRHLGDKHDVVFGNNYTSAEHFIEKGEMMVRGQLKDVVVCVPIYLYSHSGMTISTSPFSCQWDSGCCGFAVVTKADIRKMQGIKRVTQKHIDDAARYLEGEVETLDQEMRGDVYGFTIEGDDELQEDSCGGFYGSDLSTNGMSDYLDQEQIDALTKAW